MRIALALLPILIGCSDGNRGSGARSGDSAGIRIVSSDRPQWPTGTEWSVDSAPLIDLGPIADSVGMSSITGMVMRRDGSVIVGDDNTSTIWFFDASGRVVGKVGRKGEGPGEFASLSRLRVDGDSVLVWDRSLSRITALGADATVGSIRTVSFAGTYTAPGVEGRWSDGNWLFTEGTSISSSQAIGIVRGSVGAIRLGPSGAADSLLGRWPGVERLAVTSPKIVSQIDLPYAHRTVIRMADSGFWVGASTEPRIDLRSTDGTLRRSLRWAADAVPIPSAELSAWRENGKKGMSGAPSDLAVPFSAAYDKALFPETRPFFATFVDAGNGELWVQRVPRWDEAGQPVPWDVIGPDGTWLGPVMMPARFVLRSVVGDRVLGEFSDADDVVHARVYRLQRSKR
jgi:hypothetical protein